MLTSADPGALGARVASVLAGAWRAQPPPLDLPPEAFADVASLLLKTGGGGLGWWRIRESPLADHPAAGELHQAYRLTHLNAALLGGRIEGAFAVLRAAGIEPILGKGWAVARSYPDAGLRPYGDADLYVPADQHARAARALGDPLREGVDLHRGFAELGDRPHEDLLRRSRVVPLGRGEIRIFGPEDHLRLLALHMLRHGALRPVWLCDVALAVESRAEGFDWGAFAAGDPRRTDWSLCALGLARFILGARLDGVPMAERAEGLPRWLMPAVLKQWSVFTVPHGSRAPMAWTLRHPSRVLAALRLRWPNAIEATVGVGGPFNGLPRLPFQLGDCLLRSARFARTLPGVLAGGR